MVCGSWLTPDNVLRIATSRSLLFCRLVLQRGVKNPAGSAPHRSTTARPVRPPPSTAHTAMIGAFHPHLTAHTIIRIDMPRLGEQPIAAAPTTQHAREQIGARRPRLGHRTRCHARQHPIGKCAPKCTQRRTESLRPDNDRSPLKGRHHTDIAMTTLGRVGGIGSVPNRPQVRGWINVAAASAPLAGDGDALRAGQAGSAVRGGTSSGAGHERCRGGWSAVSARRHRSPSSARMAPM